MATRIYKIPADFDEQQAHFTIETVDDSQYYLRIGALNSEDQRLIESLIDDGFVGFFQDDELMAIAGIVATYDAVNDRIEIDSDLPGLKLEGEYIIRFTQARPGEDGEGGIGADGEHAEIEIEDIDTGIRVRGKSGGEPDFGPWFEIRDGIDGQGGTDGEHAEIEVEDTPTNDPEGPGIRVRGKSGSEPDFGPWFHVRDGKDGEGGAAGEHAEIEVEDTDTGIRVRGKSGGEPDFGPWFHVRDGIDGEGGAAGYNGWSPKFATVPDGERRVLQVADWFGGGGTKPDIGQYIGAAGFVAAIADGVDIRGPAGRDGIDGTPGRDGTNGIGNGQFSCGSFTPTLWKAIWQSTTNNQWIAGGNDRNHISLSGASGRWCRFGDVVQYFMCFKFVVNRTQYPNGVRTIRGFISPNPHGESIIAGAHGVATPMGPNQSGGGWFPVTIQAGDRDSTVSNGQPSEGSTRNAIRVEVLDQDNRGQTFDALIAITGVYTVEG